MAAQAGPVDGPTPPPGLQAELGAALPLLERYVGWLAGPGVDWGLLGPREVPRLWDRHILNSLTLLPLLADLPAGAEVLDVGSGAGLPGLPLAMTLPTVRVRLVEPMARRTRFLDAVVADLSRVEGTAVAVDVEVVRSRAEALPPASCDVVVARAVAPLERLGEVCLPLLRPGGRLLALKGATAAEEVARAEPVLLAGGSARHVRLVPVQGPGGATANVVEVVAARHAPAAAPTARAPRSARPPRRRRG